MLVFLSYAGGKTINSLVEIARSSGCRLKQRGLQWPVCQSLFRLKRKNGWLAS